MKSKFIKLIQAFQQLGYVINKGSLHETILFVFCDKKSMFHDVRIKEKYAGVVEILLQACGFEIFWDNDEVCKVREGKQKIFNILVKEYHCTHEHCELTTSDKLLDYITQWGSGRFAVYKVGESPLIDLS